MCHLTKWRLASGTYRKPQWRTKTDAVLYGAQALAHDFEGDRIDIVVTHGAIVIHRAVVTHGAVLTHAVDSVPRSRRR